MTLNDLECPIHLKVRLVDGSTFVVGFEVDQTHIDVARGGVEGVGWRA